MKNLKVAFLSYFLLSFLVSHLENGTLFDFSKKVSLSFSVFAS